MTPISTIGAGCLLVHDDSVLLVSPNYGPAKGGWIFPGGFLESGETPAETALRELKEETGQEGEVESLLCVRYRLKPTDIYWVFKCKKTKEAPLQIEEAELLGAKFWKLEEALRSLEVRPMTRYFLSHAMGLKADEKILPEEYRTNNITYFFS